MYLIIVAIVCTGGIWMHGLSEGTLKGEINPGPQRRRVLQSDEDK